MVWGNAWHGMVKYGTVRFCTVVGYVWYPKVLWYGMNGIACTVWYGLVPGGTTQHGTFGTSRSLDPLPVPPHLLSPAIPNPTLPLPLRSPPPYVLPTNALPLIPRPRHILCPPWLYAITGRKPLPKALANARAKVPLRPPQSSPTSDPPHAPIPLSPSTFHASAGTCVSHANLALPAICTVAGCVPLPKALADARERVVIAEAAAAESAAEAENLRRRLRGEGEEGGGGVGMGVVEEVDVAALERDNRFVLLGLGGEWGGEGGGGGEGG